MELGEKLYLARKEAGFTQRQLCEGIVTRNMLSLIEHGTAKPSMDTLRLLAARLGKPMGWFLEEDAVLSPNQALMARVESLRREGSWGEVWLLLKDFRLPDPVLEGRWRQLCMEAGLAAAEQALETGKFRYARELLEEAEGFCREQEGFERRRRLLLGRIPGVQLPEIVKGLPSLDEELLLRAGAAILEEKPDRAGALLEAADDREAPRWKLLRGWAYVMEQAYEQGAACLRQVEGVYPEECRRLLEVCFRELGDYKRAYEYACKQR